METPGARSGYAEGHGIYKKSIPAPGPHGGGEFGAAEGLGRAAGGGAAWKISAGTTLEFIARARKRSPFPFQTLQSDHGPEFSKWFTGHVAMTHRHIRVGKPNDNAHIERFNRTIQDELLWKIPTTIPEYQKALPPYLRYYNTERKHMGIEYHTPMQKVAILFPRSWR